MSDYDSEADTKAQESLSNPDVVTKYKVAAKIVNEAIATVVAAARPGAKVVELCDLGDKFIADAVAKEFKGKDIEKGVAVPTCISINNCVGHFSPTADNPTEVKEGGLVKIDLGAHIDGYIVQSAHTVLVQPDPVAPATGRSADALAAAAACFDAAARLMRPGHRASEVPPVLAKIAEAYGVQLVEGVLSHQLTRFIIDGSKAVLNRPGADQKVNDFEFEEGEVYAIDIVVSTGEGKPKVFDEKETTVYKRALDVQYQLKLKASREVYSEVLKKHSTSMFTLRSLGAERSRFGLVECVTHGLLHPYPVMWEKAGDLVAQVKGTVLLMPNGSDRVTTAPHQAVQSDKSIEDEDVKALLATSLKSKKKMKKKAGKEGSPTEN